MSAPEVVLVVGNGMVGHRFLERMKKHDTTNRFTLVTMGEEPLPHYNRMLLTEYFEHQSVEQLQLASAAWYGEQGIALSLDCRVVAIDPDAKIVTCSRLSPSPNASPDTFTVAYDRLVLATGSSAAMPSLPGVNLRGVFGYRTIADLDAIIAYCHAHQKQQSPGPKKVALVVGGGLLGLEAAKAIHDLGVGVRIINRGGRLLSRQLDDAGSKLLQTEIERQFGINVLFHKTTRRIVSHNSDCVGGVEFVDGECTGDVFLVVFATGIVPRDELARHAGLAVASRGGIVVNDVLATSADHVYALGECVSHRGVSYGLVAPGYEMADVLAKHLTSVSPGAAAFTGSDSSTKLKLMGMEVASFGACFPHELAAEDSQYEELVYNNPLEKVYKRLFFSRDGTKLLGGILVGDANDFPRLTLLYRTRQEKPLVDAPNELLLGKRRSAGEARAAVLDLPDEAQVCSCNNVTKGELCATIRDQQLTTLGDVKKHCNAGTACGGCLPMVKDLLEAELHAAGTAVDKSLCEHFAFSRQELFQIIQVEKHRTFAAVLAKHGRPTEPSTSSRQRHGCEICKPTVASILASLLNQHILLDDRAGLQDSNDRFLANLQKSGQFSIVPRIAGGEITPDKLIVLGNVAKQFGLYTKITGGQRVDLFGAEKHELPQIWDQLVKAGFESGHAYGKSLRTVKSCVGSTWCRFGVQDAVGFAIFLENRYKGVRSPHKIKGGVSGCTRECAEARSKDFGCIATEKGYNLFVCGNGGTTPMHAVLLASDVPQPLVVQYLDRFLMYYIRTADRLQRTSKWLASLDGGIDQLRRVVIEDALGICETLEREMHGLLNTYECEWKRVIETPALRAQFQQFANTATTQQEVTMKTTRDQKLPATGRSGYTKKKKKSTTGHVSPTASTASSSSSVESHFELDWISVGAAANVLPNTGRAVLYGDTQLALFNVTELCNGIDKISWYATQNVCPHDHAFVLAQGIVGDQHGHAKVTCPMHKRSFALDTGVCLSGEDYALETFDVRDQDGQLFVLLPPVEVLDARLGTTKFVQLETENETESREADVTVTSDGGGSGGGGCGDARLDW